MPGLVATARPLMIGGACLDARCLASGLFGLPGQLKR
jgi:hypothetical protein